MHNNEITTNNNINLSVKINETNKHNVNSINLNKNYSNFIDQSLNNSIELQITNVQCFTNSLLQITKVLIEPSH